MDVKQAKEALRRAYLVYTERDEFGSLRIPAEQQRPLLLMGPPGVGKTAILSQLAEELGAGLVAYTMTHHTRQSAIGLPLIREKTYGGKTCSATEYTMSEILASIYDQMEQTGQKTGFLFLDEINCVSETLVPAMLQLLQKKEFGKYRVPEGWVIAAAGNPPEYNGSARRFDAATMDRVRLIEVEADYAVWRTYALSRGVHPAVMSFLELEPERFYRVEPHGHGAVTARGWEDLSTLLSGYERLDFPIEDAVFGEFLQEPETAAATRQARGAESVATLGLENGRRAFDAACAVCHAESGGVGHFGVRPLMGLNTIVSQATPDNLLRVLHHGIDQPATDGLGYMPGFGDAFDDRQMAELAAYIRARYAPGQPAWQNLPEASAKIRQAGAH